MPVAPGPGFSARSALLFGFSGLMIAVALGIGVFWLANTGAEVEFRLGDSDFDAGQVGRISAEIAERGPILYSDVAGHDRDILLSHSGDDPAAGWLAFAARPAGAPRDCFFRWDPQRGLFELVLSGAEPGNGTGACGAVTMDATGRLSGGGTIESYPVTVDADDSIRVDINNPLPPDGQAPDQPADDTTAVDPADTSDTTTDTTTKDSP